MGRTERLYYTDCYLQDFEARLLRVEPDAKGFRVYLDRTAFYPESGGQPSDAGSLDGIALLGAMDDGDDVAHLLAGAPKGENVKGRVDWMRRFDHMQQHTGQHVLSSAFEKSGEYQTVSFHMGGETSTIDLNSDRLGQRQIDAAEDLANEVVFQNRQVRIFFQPATVAQDMDLRKPTSREGDIRLVEVEGFDLSACGGTHVNQTGAIGIIAVRKFERMKGLTRVQFVCGRRALSVARCDLRLLSQAAALFSAGFESVPQLITKQAEDLREALRRREKLAGRLADYMADEIWQKAPDLNGRRVIRHVFSWEEAAEAKKIAHSLAKRSSGVALIGVRGKPAALYFSQSPGGAHDMGGILRQTVEKFGGKGGGARDFAQGGGLDEARLEEALEYAASLAT